MLWFVMKRCRWVWRRSNATAEDRAFCLGAMAATVAVLVHSVFVNSLFATFVMEPLWVLWGLTFLIARDLKQRQPAAVMVAAG
jgi:hypothetical protein